MGENILRTTKKKPPCRIGTYPVLYGWIQSSGYNLQLQDVE